MAAASYAQADASLDASSASFMSSQHEEQSRLSRLPKRSNPSCATPASLLPLQAAPHSCCRPPCWLAFCSSAPPARPWLPGLPGCWLSRCRSQPTARQHRRRWLSWRSMRTAAMLGTLQVCGCWVAWVLGGCMLGGWFGARIESLWEQDLWPCHNRPKWSFNPKSLPGSLRCTWRCMPCLG